MKQLRAAAGRSPRRLRRGGKQGREEAGRKSGRDGAESRKKNRPRKCAGGGNSRSVQSVKNGGIEVERILVGTSVVGEERRAGDDGQRQGIDERVRGEVGHAGAEIGEHRLGRVDREDALVLRGLHVFHFEHADETREQVEGLGGFFRAFDLAFENDDVDLRILVCLTDLAGEEGFDLELRIGSDLHGIDLEGQFICGESFQRIFDHIDTSCGCFPILYHVWGDLSIPRGANAETKERICLIFR